MKTIQFDGDNRQHQEAFVFIHQGFLLGTPEGGIPGLSGHIRASKILEKMNEISSVVKNEDDETVYYQTGDEVRQLNKDGGTLELEDEQATMLKSHIEAFLPQVRVGASHKVVAAMEMLE